jgi:hypothetical protein
VANSNHKWTQAEGTDQAESNECRELPETCKMALRTREKQSKDTLKLLQRIKDINLGLSTDNWRVPDIIQLEPKDQWLILLVCWNSAYQK